MRSGIRHSVGDNVTLRLPASPAAISAARAAVVRAALDRDVPDDVLDTLRLLVSEVVTNSIRHGVPTEVVELALTFNSELRVEVTDYGKGFEPEPRAGGTDDAGGWGLYLVDRLAERWGVQRNGVTRVWFSLATV